MKKKETTNNKLIWFLLLGIILIIPTVWILTVRFEKTPPSINIEFPKTSVGETFEINGSISDRQTGLRTFWIGILQNGSEIELLRLNFDAGMIYKGGKKHYEIVKKTVEPKKLSLSDGKATLRMVVMDYSWRGGGKGNKTYIEKEITIDTKAPEIDILTTTHNVSQGGSGLVIYKTSEPGAETGVFVDKVFFPGHSGYFNNKGVHLAFFALGPKQGKDIRIFVTAKDQAGNKTQAGFSYYIKRRKFKEDTIGISDNFLNWKMPEFNTREFGVAESSGIQKFLAVNSKLREKNGLQITLPGKRTDKKKYWDGAFGRLPKSANRAGFADYRSYMYNGKLVDNQYHMGIDLASIKRSDVPAANYGKVVLAENIGIYGKTVVIDHGFGLFSLYAHLSQIDVPLGKVVSKGESLGRTGTTGLAGGDHLHFGMFIHNVFVNPVEWWDATWIRHNITSKLEDIESFIN